METRISPSSKRNVIIKDIEQTQKSAQAVLDTNEEIDERDYADDVITKVFGNSAINIDITGQLDKEHEQKLNNELKKVPFPCKWECCVTKDQIYGRDKNFPIYSLILTIWEKRFHYCTKRYFEKKERTKEFDKITIKKQDNDFIINNIPKNAKVTYITQAWTRIEAKYEGSLCKIPYGNQVHLHIEYPGIHYFYDIFNNDIKITKKYPIISEQDNISLLEEDTDDK